MPEAPADMPAFTDEQMKNLLAFMEQAGKARAGEQGAEFSETDYLAGCMATLFALGRQGSIPAGWIFSTMAGRSPLDLPTLDQTVYVVHAPRLARDEQTTIYKNRRDADEHTTWLEEQGQHVYMRFEKVRNSLRPDLAKALEEAD
jgi:hypothetical protein